MNKHTYTNGCVECGSRNVPIWCKLNKPAHTPTPLNEIQGVMKPFEVKYGYSKQDLLFPNGEHIFFNTPRDARRTMQAVNCHEELLESLKTLHSDCLTCEKGRVECAHANVIAKAEGH